MSDWVAAELAACQMHDVRHTKRLARLLDRLSERPVGSIPTACHGWAETVAAYRFLHNPRIDAQEILSGHTHATPRHAGADPRAGDRVAGTRYHLSELRHDPTKGRDGHGKDQNP